MQCFVASPSLASGRRRTSSGTCSRTAVAMKARRKTFKQVPSEDVPGKVDEETSKKLAETAREFGLDTSGQVRADREESAETTFYRQALKTVGKDGLGIIEGALWAVGGGALGFILIVGTAVAFLAYYKATGAAVPPWLDELCASGEPVFTPALGVFLGCTTTLGLLKFAEFDYNEEMELKDKK